MECKFYVGQKVVYVGRPSDLPPSPGYGFEKRPSIGQVYTIREIAAFRSGVGIRLVEIVNAAARYSDAGIAEAAFDYRSFRPAVEPKTDISELREIVRKVFDGERVGA